MEDSNYFLKTLGLETFISQDALPRMGINNMDFPALSESKLQMERLSDNTSQRLKDDTLEKQEIANEDGGQIATHVQADDFFSSLELQSSSKTSSNVTTMNFSNKSSGGIVTRSRSHASALHETNKPMEKKFPNLKAKKINKSQKKKKSGKVCLRRKISSRKTLKPEFGKKMYLDSKDKMSSFSDAKKHNSNKLNENILEKGLVIDKNKEEDDWVLFGHLNSKKDSEDKVFENKQSFTTDAQNSVRRCTPEFFSMNSILMSDTMSEGKYEVDKLLEVDDYDDSFLEEIEDFNYAPPRSHTGGKWKPGSLSIRTSPMFWQSQNWDTLLDDEERKHRVDTPVDPLELPGEKAKLLSTSSTIGKLKNCIPPPTHTGGKWKPLTPPATHTGGKWKPLTPPASYTGGKWKPLEAGKTKKCDHDLISSDDGSHNWKCEDETELEITHTGGKWKPGPNHSTELWKTGSPESASPHNHTGENWESGKGSVSRSTFDVLANCQSTPGKCLKTAGGMIQYYCSPCNRRLSSKKMYKKHIQSELHFKRVLQENELEFDSRSIKLFHGLFTQGNYKERGIGKRVIKKPEIFQNTGSLKKERISGVVKIRKKRILRRETIRCEVCKIKMPRYQLGKHLVSYYHSRRIQLNDPNQQKLILDNIHTIVKQAPYQCGICKFYFNTHKLFKKHWALDIHKEMEKHKYRRFWCALCNFECETSRSMELHLDSNSHREVMLAVNKSIPIIIRQKVIFNCRLCSKEFRSNRELISHEHSFHKITEGDASNKLVCSICQQKCKSLKSLQRHILHSHKDAGKLLYFCTTCNKFFNSAEEAKIHRASELHKSKIPLEESIVKKKLWTPCYFCGKTLENISKLKIHLFENHSGFLPKCIKCGEVFALSQEVSRHVKSNKCNFGQKTLQASELTGSFSCKRCSFGTNLKSEFLLHVAVHEKKPDEKKISCPLCKSNFTQAALAVHLKAHLKEMTYQCTLCSVTFMRKDRYVRHLKLKHFVKEDLDSSHCKEIIENKAESTDSENKKKQTIVKEAVEVESDKKCNTKIEKRQVCGDAKCKYVAKDLDDLESHRLFHVAPKTYQCPECPYTAKTNTIIKRHYLTHIDERSFPCNFCTFKARLKSHLKRHMRLHTGAKPFKCPHCAYTCNNLENLRKHVLYTKIHPGKKLYECKFCGFDTNVSKDFKIHLTNNHKDDCKPNETNEAAGIYKKEEDFDNALTPIPAKARVFTAKPLKTTYSTGFEKRKRMITQTFSSIAPKSSFVDDDTAPCGHLKVMGNSIEDKRKILKMELEKLKSQIKPVLKKALRSYPSPAGKELKMKMSAHVNEGQVTGVRKNLSKADAANTDTVCTQIRNMENGVLLLNVLPSTSEEISSKLSKDNNATVQNTEFPSTYILYENVLPSEEMELCLLEGYHV